jgi:hypothetical protein
MPQSKGTACGRRLPLNVKCYGPSGHQPVAAAMSALGREQAFCKPSRMDKKLNEERRKLKPQLFHHVQESVRLVKCETSWIRPERWR